MNDDFKRFIEEHINMCEDVLKFKNYSRAEELQGIIINAFSQFIPNIDSSLDCIWIYPSTKQVDYIGNIKKLRDKLKVLLITNGKYSIDNKTNMINSNPAVPAVVVNANSSVSGSGNSTNTNTNTQNQTVNNTFDIKVELDKVRAEVEADEVLGDEDKEEINEKLNEIEEVMNESPTNNEKWKKLKGVVNWVTTKGFKIGKMIMPIITKALFHEE